MNQPNAVQLLEGIHPGFFAQASIRKIPKDRIFEEMLLPLREFDGEAFSLPVPEGVSFGFYAGPREELLKAVERVGPGWVPLFKPGERVYCGMCRGQIASFCLLEDMGTHLLDGHRVRVAGPGCVGTVPAFRRQGIGLRMVRDATAVLRQEGYDISYIHFTGVANWYAKLGYCTCLRWTSEGPLPEKEK